jgi:hypothetical protein
LRNVDLGELLALGLRFRTDLVRLQVDESLEHLALYAHGDVLAGAHRERSGQKPGDARQDDDLVVNAGARHAEDQRHVRDQSVFHAEDRGTQGAGPPGGGLLTADGPRMRHDAPLSPSHATHHLRQQVQPRLRSEVRWR